MAKPKGGARPGAGRPKMTEEQKDIKALARRHTDAALQTLVNVMLKSKNEVNKANAAKDILDRAYGKPSQQVTGDAEQPIAYTIRWEK